MKNLRNLLLLLLLTIASAKSATISLMWDPSPSVGVSGYRLYYSAAGTNLSVVDVGNKTTGDITNAVNGSVYTIYATAYSTNGVESEPSNTLLFSVPDTFPNQPVLLSSAILQTNGTLRIKIDWKPAPFEDNVTAYKLDVLTNGFPFTNIWTTNMSNLSATFTVNQKHLTVAYLSASNYFGLSKSNLMGSWQQPFGPRMTFGYLK
jgi:hypothetical protein